MPLHLSGGLVLQQWFCADSTWLAVYSANGASVPWLFEIIFPIPLSSIISVHGDNLIILNESSFETLPVVRISLQLLYRRVRQWVQMC